MCDVICTSGNAEKIVHAAPADKDLLFVPDENLGQWVMEQTGRPMTLWKGNCYAHVEFRRDAMLQMRAQFPDAKVVVHPESLREVRDLADAVCSTEKMITYCRDNPGEAVRDRDRIGHHPSDAEGMSGQGVHLRADVRRDAAAHATTAVAASANT